MRSLGYPDVEPKNDSRLFQSFPYDYGNKQKDLRLFQLIWLIIDAKNWERPNPLLEWSLREPGSLSAGMRGLHFALYNNIEQPELTLELLETVHRLSTEATISDPHRLGHFDKCEVLGHCRTKFDAGQWMTQAELDDSYSNWFEFKAGFRDQQHALNQIESTFFNNNQHLSSLCRQLGLVFISEKECGNLYNKAHSKNHFHKMIEEHYRSELDDQRQSTTYLQDAVARIGKGDGVAYLCTHKDKDFTVEHLKTVFSEYNHTIKSMPGVKQKLKLILETVQKIEMLHPFEDGNLRTCVILMQRLLYQNRLPFSAFIDPFEFDYHSVDKLESSYIAGVDLFNKIITSSPSKANELLESVCIRIKQGRACFLQLMEPYFNDSQFAESHMRDRLKKDRHCQSTEWINLVSFDIINAWYLQGSVGTLRHSNGPYLPRYCFPSVDEWVCPQYVSVYNETQREILNTIGEGSLTLLSTDTVSGLVKQYKEQKIFIFCLLLSLGKRDFIANNTDTTGILTKGFACSTYASFLHCQFLSRIAPRPLIAAGHYLHCMTDGAKSRVKKAACASHASAVNGLDSNESLFATKPDVTKCESSASACKW